MQTRKIMNYVTATQAMAAQPLRFFPLSLVSFNSLFLPKNLESISSQPKLYLDFA
jgi:hypothetical protein